MRKAIQFAKRSNRWELLSTNLKPHLAEMPFLQDIITALDALVVQAKSLDTVQEVARTTFQDAVHKRQELEKQGEELRRRADSHLRGSFGFTSDDLVKFGIQPRKKGPRGPNKKPPVETPPAAGK
ncbi:MAG TPA: hypothetical protein VLX28_23320 [Thermoanaerobaculia bacterium]|nr:hypothetical protein [Thermoanaerobaculia bacterium]